MEPSRAVWLGHTPGWQLIFAAEFSGWVVIYGKHHDVRLFASKA